MISLREVIYALKDWKIAEVIKAFWSDLAAFDRRPRTRAFNNGKSWMVLVFYWYSGVSGKEKTFFETHHKGMVNLNLTTNWKHYLKMIFFISTNFVEVKWWTQTSPRFIGELNSHEGFMVSFKTHIKSMIIECCKISPRFILPVDQCYCLIFGELKSHHQFLELLNELTVKSCKSSNFTTIYHWLPISPRVTLWVEA